MTWILPESQRVPSPNCSQGRAGVAVDVLVLHYAVDGDDFERGEDEHATFRAVTPQQDCHDVARLFARKSRGASAHFAVGRDGSNAQLVSLADTAWHAGGGAFPDKGTGPLERPRPYLMNRRSIGIELCNAGWAVDKIGVPKDRRAVAAHPARPRKRREWEVYTDPQLSALEDIVAMSRPHFAVDRPLFAAGHEDVVNRDTLDKPYSGKVDPGPLFPWERFAPFLRRIGISPVRYDFKTRSWVERDE